MMARHEVIQTYIDLFDEPRYMEIGVSKGATFHAVTAHKKVAVDPQFQIEKADIDPASEYHEVPSDVYFRSLSNNGPMFDVIYLDGLHTFEQTLRDLMNAINCLQYEGVIVVDDILPNSYHSSLADHRETVAVREAVNGSDHSWMGDTYKLVFFVQSFLPNFDYATVRDNHGQLVLWRGERSPDFFVERNLGDIARLEFRHIVCQKEAYNFLANDTIAEKIRLRTWPANLRTLP